MSGKLKMRVQLKNTEECKECKRLKKELKESRVSAKAIRLDLKAKNFALNNLSKGHLMSDLSCALKSLESAKAEIERMKKEARSFSSMKDTINRLSAENGKHKKELARLKNK